LPIFGTELSLKNAQNNSSIEVDFDKKLAKKYQSKLKIEDDKRGF
jgi:hypothetical protein